MRVCVTGHEWALGARDTIEQASAVREDAIAYPERFPACRPTPKKTTPAPTRQIRALLEAECDSITARVRLINLKLEAMG